jgi:hypothetical protein
LAADSGRQRVTVHNPVTRDSLSGRAAPMRKNLGHWLATHPGYIVSRYVDDVTDGSALAAQLGDGMQSRGACRSPIFSPPCCALGFAAAASLRELCQPPARASAHVLAALLNARLISACRS